MEVKMGKEEGKRNVLRVVEELALPVINEMDIELVGIEYKMERGKPHLVVYIDRPGGVRLEDCERANKALGQLFDREDPITSSYTLEVSSPGIERPLYKKDDYLRFKGSYVKLKTYVKINDCKNFIGLLKDLEGESVIIETDHGVQFTIPLHEIAKANLFYK
jgi:ribosome maturation factor RimP